MISEPPTFGIKYALVSLSSFFLLSILPHLLHNFCNFSFLLTEISMTVASKSLPLKQAAEVSMKLESPKLVCKYTYHLYALPICFQNLKKQCGKICWRVLQGALHPSTETPQHWFVAEFCTVVQCKFCCKNLLHLKCYGNEFYSLISF